MATDAWGNGSVPQSTTRARLIVAAVILAAIVCLIIRARLGGVLVEAKVGRGRTEVRCVADRGVLCKERGRKTAEAHRTALASKTSDALPYKPGFVAAGAEMVNDETTNKGHYRGPTFHDLRRRDRVMADHAGANPLEVAASTQ